MKFELVTKAKCKVVIGDAKECVSVQIIQPTGKSELYTVNKEDAKIIADALSRASNDEE